MRVLLTTDTVGGVWTFTKELSAGLLERGHAVALVSLGRLPCESQEAWTLAAKARYGSNFHYDALDVPLEWMEKNCCSYSSAEPVLLDLIEAFDVDIVHTSQFCFGALPVDVPKVITVHSDVLSWAAACRVGGLEETKWLHRYLSFVRTGLAGADVVVAPTHWMRGALERNFPLPRSVAVILNGRSLAGRTGNPPRKVQAVTVGRIWDEAKGLRILSGVHDCLPILVVGEAHFECERASEVATAEFLGQLAEDELLHVFRSNSLYLVTSVYEPFGLAPLEAALCGCGVVARDIPSLREVWGRAAEYFTDSETLTTLLLELRHFPAALASLRARSMRRALELSAARMVDGYETQYEILIAQTASPGEVAVYAG